MKYFIKAMTQYADFEGRARRAEYWYFQLFYYIFLIGCSLMDEMAGTEFLAPVFFLATIIPRLAVAVRRMHDTGSSGWFILVPIYNLISFISAGDVGPNEYGPDPKDEELEQPEETYEEAEGQ